MILTETALVSGAALGAGMAIYNAAGIGVGAVLGTAVTAWLGAGIGIVHYSKEEIRAQLVREGIKPENVMEFGGLLGAVVGTTVGQVIWASYRQRNALPYDVVGTTVGQVGANYRQLNALPYDEARLVLRRDLAAIRAVRLGIRILSGNVDSDSSSSSSSSDSDSD